MTKSDNEQSSLQRPNDAGSHAGFDRWRIASKGHSEEEDERAYADRYWTVACVQIMRNFLWRGLFLRQLSRVGHHPPLRCSGA